MKKFTKLSSSGSVYKTINEIQHQVKIIKFQKDGAKRLFFAPEYKGIRLTTTMYSRKYEAVKLAKQFLRNLK